MFIITIISYYHEKGCPDFTDLLMGSMQILQMKITKHTVMFSEWFLTETKIAHWADEFSTDAFGGNACNNL